jgi:hypothetical protein
VPIALAVAIVVGAVAVAVGLMLFVRSRAPAGGFYSSSRGIGIYGAVQGSLGILIAFVIFLAFQSYLAARTAAQTEATAVAQLYRAAGLFPSPTRQDLRAGLACYARAAAGPEWDSMSTGTISPLADDASDAIDNVFERAVQNRTVPDVAKGQWLGAVQDRAEAHQRRLTEAQPYVPTLLWILLVGGLVLVAVYLLTFADSTERPWLQALMIAGPVGIVAAGLVLVYFFSHPYSGYTGSIKPTAMTRTLARMQQLSRAHAEPIRLVCDANGKLLRPL